MSKTVMGDRDKIGGYDAWRVEDAVRTMQKAEEIKVDAKFLKVVIKEMNREADKLEGTADFLVKTSTKLNKVFGKKGNNNGS